MIRKLLVKYRKQLSYVFWGVATTLVNYVVYFGLVNGLGVHYLEGNIIAWAAAVLFAFVTNKRYVYRSESRKIKTVICELARFVSARLLSGAMETGLMALCVECFSWNESLVKLGVGVAVVVINYIFGEFFVFRHKKEEA